MTVEVERRGDGTVVVRVSGILDASACLALERLLEGLADASEVTVDLSAVRAVDASGISVLFRLAGRVGALRVTGAPLPVRTLLDGTGLGRVARIE